MVKRAEQALTSLKTTGTASLRSAEKCNTLSADQKRRKHESLEEDCQVTEINRLQNDSTQCMFDFMQPDGITATTLESIVDNERFGSQ